MKRMMLFIAHHSNTVRSNNQKPAGSERRTRPTIKCDRVKELIKSKGFLSDSNHTLKIIGPSRRPKKTRFIKPF